MNANAAMALAIIAAASRLFEDTTEASAHMMKIEWVVTPRAEMVPRYEKADQCFLAACKRHDYMNGRRK